MNPIDWRPTSGGEDKYGAGVPSEKNEIEGTGVGHRRRGSGGSNRSFVSADAHNGMNPAASSIPAHHASSGSGGMIADLPAHDFTAGPAGNEYSYGSHQQQQGLAPIGGYADLRRGTSPSPVPSLNGGYGGYGATGYGGGGY